MLEPFYEYLRFEKRCSEHTLTAYTHDLEHFIRFAGLSNLSEFNALKPVFIRGWMVTLLEEDYNNKSVNRKMAALRTLYKWLNKEGKAEHNPLSRLRGPKIEKRLPSFAREQELAAPRLAPMFNDDFEGTRDELLVELLYQTGMRLSELIGLSIHDVQSNHLKVLGKRNKERLIPIAPELNAKIQAYLILRAPRAKTTHLLILNNGKPLYSLFVYRKIHTILGSLTHLDKRSPHVLRHTFATHMLNNGAGLETLKALLGHASLAATQVYTHNSFAQLHQIYKHAHPRMKRG